MGDFEWGVSGGGSMSQTMTSERGQKTQAKTYKNYIGGHWVESKTGRTFTSLNPAHKDQVLGVMQASNADDVNAAIEAAEKAFTAWRQTPAPAHGETVPSELKNKWCMTVRVPLGVVACITPWNFPMAIPSWKIFPAVMAGNTVVFKPASDTPIVATKL